MLSSRRLFFPSNMVSPSDKLNFDQIVSVRARVPILSLSMCTFGAKCVMLLIHSKQMDKYIDCGPSRHRTVRFCQAGVRERTVGLQLLRRETVKEINIWFWREWESNAARTLVNSRLKSILGE